jgi:hypothetical protein
MTHQLPPHDQLPPEMLVMAPTFTADGSDQVQQSGSPSAVEQQLLGSQPSTPAASIGRKRKKASGSVEGVQSPTEPRRLRRSHEVRARSPPSSISSPPGKHRPLSPFSRSTNPAYHSMDADLLLHSRPVHGAGDDKFDLGSKGTFPIANISMS